MIITMILNVVYMIPEELILLGVVFWGREMFAFVTSWHTYSKT